MIQTIVQRRSLPWPDTSHLCLRRDDEIRARFETRETTFFEISDDRPVQDDGAVKTDPRRDSQEFCAVSPDLISAVTDAVLEEAGEWQNRPLDLCYPLVFFDAIRVKIRDEGFARNKAVYIALAVLPEGTKEILGLWIEQAEGAKFWLRVMNELKNRGCEDILIAVVDGLKGFPEAITAAFPQTIVQTCIVHLIRHSLEFRLLGKPVIPALRAIYRAKDAEARMKALEAFEAGYWGQNVRPSHRVGGATGNMPFPSSPFPRSCTASSIRQMPG